MYFSTLSLATNSGQIRGQTKKVSSRSEMITEGWTGPGRALWAFILHVCRTEYILDWNFAGKGAMDRHRMQLGSAVKSRGGVIQNG